MSTSAQQVPDPEVPTKPTSRTYTAAYKSRILAEYDGLGKVAKGALLRRQGLYSSLITAWQKQRDRGARQALAAPAGRPPADPRDRENARLRKENERLRGRVGDRPEGHRCSGKTLRAAGSTRDRQSADRPPDPNDHHVLAAAHAGEVDFLVTCDGDGKNGNFQQCLDEAGAGVTGSPRRRLPPHDRRAVSRARPVALSVPGRVLAAARRRR
jgi:transposase